MHEKELKVIETSAVTITPMTLIQQAQAGDASIEQMQQLFDLQLRWEDNEAKKAFNRGMSLFKSECPVIPKNSQGQSGKFAGLADIAKVADPILAKHGLSYRWEQSQGDDKKELTVKCIVTHIDGHSVSSPMTGPLDTSGNKNAIQSIGSSNKYLFRYTLEAALGLASSEMDDDGKGSDAPPVEVITDDQYANLDALMEEVKANRKGFFTAYKIPSLEMLPATMYDHAVKSLEAKRK